MLQGLFPYSQEMVPVFIKENDVHYYPDCSALVNLNNRKVSKYELW